MDARRSFEFRGDLREKALPEILNTVERFQVPGVLDAEAGGVVKQIYIRDGCVIHANSSDLEDSLGAYLFRTGRLTPQQYVETMRLRETSEKLYGALVVEEGLVPPATIFEAIREHVEAIVWSLFYWTEGTILFRIGEFPPPQGTRVLLPLQHVIMEGIRRAPDARLLIERLGDKGTVFEPSYRIEDLIRVALTQEEMDLLLRVDGEQGLFDHCCSGSLSPHQNAKLMYAFSVLRLIRRKEEEKPADGALLLDDLPSPKSPEPTIEAEEPAVEPAPPVPSEGRVKIRFKTAGDRFSTDD